VSAQGTAQPSLRRLREFGVRPNRELGQNFLVDSNILSVIGAAAGLEPHDSVLEIGGGVGILSEYLAERVAHLHVIEVDRHLEGALRDATDRFANVQLHWGDAVRIDLRALAPEPNKVVANLPYGIATSALVRTVDELPSITSWVVMVQREVGERLAARPGERAYGASSVIVQLACEVKLLRAIPRTVFFPAPNVDSVLLGMHRRATAGAPPDAAAEAALRALVHGAFAHRRKTLAGSLALAAAAQASESNRREPDPALSRERVRAALTQIGHPADVRAERLSPQDFVELAALLS
jgi:16S rRNA (adenine1518-N6/adenine1519-N6)-dimethyltransferase